MTEGVGTVLYPDAIAPAPLPAQPAITGYQQSPRVQLVDLLSGAFEDAPGDESGGEMDLDLSVLGGELLDDLILLL
ncbi:MAG: hypothetical protein QGH60_09790 [Phycisphaerae bacterium]|jgi:hypothetical protein|nr:hypothetical protein [Phycisphaerae bacterium]